MSVDVPRVLSTFGAAMMMGDVVEASTDYQQRTNFTLGTLLVFASQEWDASADRLVTENASVEAIFRNAVPHLADRELAERVDQTLAAGAPDLKVSTLRARNDALRALLIDVHAHVETLEGPEAERIDREIWDELVESTERRVLPGAPI